MATNMVQVAEDGIWTFTVTADEIEALLRDPQKFITGRLPNEGITFQFYGGAEAGYAAPPAPITIVFHYGVPGAGPFQVQGIKRTNIVTVRGPEIAFLDRLNDNAGTLEAQLAALRRQIPDPRIQSKRLREPKLAFSHFKPGDVVDEGYGVIAKFITNPSLLVEWLNRQEPDPDPKVVLPDNSEVDDKLVLRYRLPAQPNLFRYHYQTFVDPIGLDMVRGSRTLRVATLTGDAPADDPPGDDPDDDEPIVEQCSKPSGAYTEEGDNVVMEIDQVIQTLWIPEPAPQPDPIPVPTPPDDTPPEARR